MARSEVRMPSWQESWRGFASGRDPPPHLGLCVEAERPLQRLSRQEGSSLDQMRTEWAIQEAAQIQQTQGLKTSCWTREARGPGCGLNTGMRPGGRDPGNRTHLVEVVGRSQPPSSSACWPLKGSSVPFPRTSTGAIPV